MRNIRRRFGLVGVVAAGLLAGCGDSPPSPSATATGGGVPSSGAGATSGAVPASTGAAVTATSDSSSPAAPGGASTVSPDATTAGAGGFSSAVRPLSKDEEESMTGVTWQPGCPVPLADLRHVTVSYWDFEGRSTKGALVVHADTADRTVEVFGKLYDQRFPIRRMEPIEAYDGDDYASIEADNTSAFNCRRATGSQQWSNHAYGRAIDINPLENPYVFDGGRTSHPRSEPYLDRADVRPGMVVEGSAAVAAFDAAGFAWGGRWESPIDTQHFEIESR